MDERLRRVLLGAFVAGLALSITLAQAALTLLAARWLWRLRAGRARRPPLLWPFAAWIVASLLAVALSPRPLESLGAARSLLLIASFYVVLDAVPTTDAAERVLAWLLGLMAGVALVGVLQVALCPHLLPLVPVLGRVATKCHRAHGFYSIYMTLAGVLSLVLLTTLPGLTAGRGTGWRLAAWGAGAAGLAATYVRGAWVGFLTGLGVLLGLARRGRIAIAAGGVALVLAVLLVPGARQRALSIVDPADPTVRERWAMWASGLRMAWDHPLLGVGPGQVKHVYPAYAAPEFRARPRGHLHNTALQILVERGAPALAAWTAVFVAFFWRAGRILRSLPERAGRERALVAGSIAAIASFLVGGLTEYNFGDSEVAMAAYVVMALPFVVARASRHRP